MVIRTRDGQTWDSGEISGTRGDAATPLAASELESKFMDCCAYGRYDRARQLFGKFKQMPAGTVWSAPSA